MNNDKVKAITDRLEQGCKELLTSENYRKYLDTMAKFYRYSANNCLLIAMQMPDASRVAGYNAWKNKFKRQVRKGEKAIQILAPCPHKKTITNTDGEEETITFTTYRPVSVFDISQTDGEDLPEICTTLTGDIEEYTRTMDALKKFSPVPIGFEPMKRANGYYMPTENRIAIKEQTL